MSEIADRVAAANSVVGDDRAWFVGVCRRVERETRLVYRDVLENIAEHLEGGNIDAALDLAREAMEGPAGAGGGAIPLPDGRTAVALASIAVHADEYMSPDGHAFDADAIRVALAYPYVQGYLRELHALALIPVKRS